VLDGDYGGVVTPQDGEVEFFVAAGWWGRGIEIGLVV
jgi:hypothetical protein